MERNAKSAGAADRDILDVSRIIQGKIRLNFRPIVPVIEAAIDAHLAADAKSMRLEPVFDASVASSGVRPCSKLSGIYSPTRSSSPPGGRLRCD